MEQARGSSSSVAKHSAWYRARLLVRLGIGAALLALLVWRVGPRGFWEALASLPLLLVPVLAVLGIVPPVSYARRWRRILQCWGAEVTGWEALRVTVAASLANYALPVFGWAPAKMLAGWRWLGIGPRRVAVSLLLEQGLDVLALGLLAIVASLALAASGRAEVLPVLPGLGGWVLIAGVLSGVVVVSAVVFGYRKWRAQVVQLVQELTVAGDRAVLGWTVLRWLAEAVILASLLVALGVPVDPRFVVLLLALPALAGLLVPVPGGLGVREATVIGLGALVGMDPVRLGAVAAWHRMALLLGLALAGCSILMGRRQ